MPVIRFPHIPTRFASGGWLTNSVGRAARDISRNSSPFCHKQTETERVQDERRSGHSSSCLEAGVSWPQFIR